MPEFDPPEPVEGTQKNPDGATKDAPVGQTDTPVDDVVKQITGLTVTTANTDNPDHFTVGKKPRKEPIPGAEKGIIFAPPEALYTNFTALYPDATPPSPETLIGLVETMNIFREQTTAIDKACTGRRLSRDQRTTMAESGTAIFNRENFEKTYSYLVKLYKEILEFQKELTRSFDRVIDPETFELKIPTVARLAALITKMQDAYPVIAREIMLSSPEMMKLVLDRLGKLEQSGNGGAQPGFQVETRKNALVAAMAATKALDSVKVCNAERAKNELVTALEVSLFTTTHFAANSLAPGFKQGENSSYAFEQYYPFKVDFILATCSCIFALLPQMREILDLLARIDSATDGFKN